jgi:predicted nucleotidyltransferase
MTAITTITVLCGVVILQCASLALLLHALRRARRTNTRLIALSLDQSNSIEALRATMRRQGETLERQGEVNEKQAEVMDRQGETIRALRPRQ